MLADKLNMTPEDAERWIVNLIRNARLDAKIDSKLVSWEGNTKLYLNFVCLINRMIRRILTINTVVSQGHVVMGTQAVSPYQQVIEKTKGLAFRSQMLVMNIEKKLGAMNKEVRIRPI